jgi:hypothetical protein
MKSTLTDVLLAGTINNDDVSNFGALHNRNVDRDMAALTEVKRLGTQEPVKKLTEDSL